MTWLFPSSMLELLASHFLQLQVVFLSVSCTLTNCYGYCYESVYECLSSINVMIIFCYALLHKKHHEILDDTIGYF